MSAITRSETGAGSFQQHYLNINDFDGNTLCTEICTSFAGLKASYDQLTVSKPSYSFIASVVIPVQCDSITEFFQSLFAPITSYALSSFDNLVAKVVIAIATVILDLATLPLRLLTSIPYLVYHLCNNENEHPIIALIQNLPQATKALAEGKVKVVAVIEDFSHIQSCIINGQNAYEVAGKVFMASSNVDIKRTFSPAGNYNMGDWTEINAIMRPEGLAHYRAFQNITGE